MEGFPTKPPPLYGGCRGCRHVMGENMDFPCRECCRNSLNPIDRFESRTNLMDDEYRCCVCGEIKNDAPCGIETDVEGIDWTYCRACDFWTEHPPVVK